MKTVPRVSEGRVPTAQRRGWALARGARELWERFRSASVALPRSAWEQWLLTLLAGFIATTLVMFAVVWIGQTLAGQGMQVWDEQLLLRIERDDLLSFHDAIWFEAWGSSAFLLPIVLVATVIGIWVRRPLHGLSILAAYALHDPFVLTAWRLWDRTRPQIIEGGIAAPALHSYPSGHMVNVVATVGLGGYLWARRSGSSIERLLVVLIVAAVAAIVGLARLRMGTHWPSDIIAGTTIGVSWLWVMIAAVRRAEAAITRATAHPPPALRP